jgi:hypothetical protein
MLIVGAIDLNCEPPDASKIDNGLITRGGDVSCRSTSWIARFCTASELSFYTTSLSLIASFGHPPFHFLLFSVSPCWRTERRERKRRPM